MKDLTKEENDNKIIEIKNEKMFYNKKYNFALYVILLCVSVLCIVISLDGHLTHFSNLLISFGSSLLCSSILGCLIEHVIKNRDNVCYTYYREKCVSKIDYHIKIILEKLIRDYSALFKSCNVKLDKISYNIVTLLEMCMDIIKENDKLNVSVNYYCEINNLNESITEYLNNPFSKESELFISHKEYESFNSTNEILFCFRNDNLYNATEDLLELIKQLSSIKELKNLENLKVVKINGNYVIEY